MKNYEISLDFYGEKVSVQCPKDFSIFKRKISEKYFLLLSDISELDISYLNKGEKKLIKSDYDYKLFLHTRINEINLSIKETSKLFKKSLIDLQNKKKDDIIKLNELKLKKEKIKTEIEAEKKNCQNQKKELDDKIKNLNQKNLEHIPSLAKKMKVYKKQENDLATKIVELEKLKDESLKPKKDENISIPYKEEYEETKLNEHKQKNIDCLEIQQKLYESPQKSIKSMDLQKREINLKKKDIIKKSQSKRNALEAEEKKTIQEIISTEKSLGINVDEKKPMKKYGFYFPNRLLDKINNKEDNKIYIEQKKNKEKNPDTPISFIKCKAKNSLHNLKKVVIDDFTNEQKKISQDIENFRNSSKELKYSCSIEDEEFLTKVEKDNEKDINKFGEWIQFVCTHTDELIEELVNKKEANTGRMSEIYRKLDRFKKMSDKDTTESESSTIFAKEMFCSICKTKITGIKYICGQCRNYFLCHECEKKDNGGHGHPLIQIRKNEQLVMLLNKYNKNN